MQFTIQTNDIYLTMSISLSFLRDRRKDESITYVFQKTITFLAYADQINYVNNTAIIRLIESNEPIRLKQLRPDFLG